ncbi:MAG: chromosomal replication initiator protein DnaA [Planctomycetes bacterium]|nr:chromosomal replication initiator protein DnaA [Planctomycetota bacterium]
MSEPPSQVSWANVRDEISRRIKKQQFDTWFRRVEAREVSSSRLDLEVPNEFIREWLQKYYLDTIRKAAEDVMRSRPQVTLRLPEGASATASDASASSSASTAHPSSVPALPVPASPVRTDPMRSGAEARLPLNPSYTFDHFVVGPSNRLAHAAALAVAEAPAQAYNPLFLHGAVGLGKTHLLQAICHHMLARAPRTDILYLSCETFVNSFIGALKSGSLDAFRRRHRTVGVLLVDDIHFLANKESTQEEFFHTFNELFDANRQIILSSDSSPMDIPTIEDRLVSRFKWGLVARIDKPNLETRVAILKQKAELRGSEIPDEVLAFVAKAVDTNIRELEGAVTKLIGSATLTARRINLALAREIFSDLLIEKRRHITIEDIQGAITARYSVKLSDLQSKRRSKSVTLPRQVCMFLARSLTDYSLEEIGGYFGGRDHTTVMYACDQIGGRVKRDAEFARMVEETTVQLRSGSRG